MKNENRSPSVSLGANLLPNERAAGSKLVVEDRGGRGEPSDEL
jgi:hypothetical protein